MLIYSVCAAISGALVLYVNWQGRKEGEDLTLATLLLSLFATFCPIVNSFVAVVGGGWFIFTESPKIVIVGKRKK